MEFFHCEARSAEAISPQSNQGIASRHLPPWSEAEWGVRALAMTGLPHSLLFLRKCFSVLVVDDVQGRFKLGALMLHFIDKRKALSD